VLAAGDYATVSKDERVRVAYMGTEHGGTEHGGTEHG
jgi:branched-chain amino acid transport system ATP-binding protein